MPEGGFLEQRRASPGSLAVVIALHAAAVTALMLSKSEFVKEVIKPITVRHIPDTPPPPPEPPQPKIEPQLPRDSQVDLVPPKIVIQRPPTQTPFERVPDIAPAFDPGPIGEAVRDPVPVPQPLPEPKPEPKPEPVRKEAQMLASSELQPPYPAAEQRAEIEGSVTVRVRSGTDGRVRSVEKVRGASEAFFRATQQQALRHWRFKPATVDGQPVESVKVLTVHFQLTA